MASSKSRTKDKNRHAMKGDTSRGRERIKGLVLLAAVPLLVLVASFVRGAVEPHQGEVPDWRPATGTAAAEH